MSTLLIETEVSPMLRTRTAWGALVAPIGVGPTRTSATSDTR